MIEERLINQIKKIIESENISSSDSNQFISNCRGILESKKIKSRFPILSFYCDWTLHPNIDRNPFLYNILGDISKGYSTNGQAGQYSVIPHLKIDKLLNEIFSFLSFINKNEKELFNNIFSIQNLLLSILENLIERKIHFPKEKNKDYHKEIKKIISESSSSQIEGDKNPIIIDSIVIKEIKLNMVKFQMSMDNLTFQLRGGNDKEVKIIEILELKIEFNKKGQLEFSFMDASNKW